MNLSTSSSDPPAPGPAAVAAAADWVAVPAPGWRRFALVFAGAAAAILASLMIGIVLLDPFDAGAFGASFRGISDEAPRTADASRARDPAFDSAIFGNSHLQLVDPAALSRRTGLSFVSMTVPGTGPREQLAVLDSFLRHHRGTARALVLDLDAVWCTEDPALPITNPFPFWLYDPSPFEQLRGLLRFSALEQAGRVLMTRLGFRRQARRDGYWNYALGRETGFDATHSDPGLVTTLINDTARFPALALLAERLEQLPSDVVVVLVRPPVHVAALPMAGSTLQRAEAECKAATEALLGRHARSSLLDARIVGATARDASLWFDATHYAEPVARGLEAEIASRIAQLAR